MSKCHRRSIVISIGFAGLLSCCIGMATAAETSAYDQAREHADKLKAAQEGSANPAAESAPKLPKTDPCKLLTDAEVREVFPDAKPGQRERTREEYGIVACLWNHPGGRFAVQVTHEKPGTVDNEIRGMAMGSVDPLNPAAREAVRYETIKSVGDQAMAIVEPADKQRGILDDVAYLVTQRGDQQIVLMSNALASRDRAAAVKALEELGKTAVSRL